MRLLLAFASLGVAACTARSPVDVPPAADAGGGGSDGDLALAIPDFAVLDLATPVEDLARPDDDLAPPGEDARSQVIAIMEKVADWQIARYGTQNPETWIDATFYAGLMATYTTTRQARFHDRAIAWAQANKWTIGGNQNPDWQCAGQTFLELYSSDKVAAHLMPTQQVMDGVIASAQPGRKVWWWADALFMAPPVFARLGAATSQDKYFTTMSTMWWDVTSALYDPASGLFFRDAGYLTKTCPNGQKMFWARGNGWVMAGLSRVLEYLPAGHAARPKLVAQLQALAARVAVLQKPDGFWPSCLTDAADYPEPETSGTAAFVFALARGVDQGILDGRLGWVQPVGAAPGPTKQTDTQPYGVGLFLLAGSEVAQLADRL